MDTTRHLISVAVGPVQEFIASARKLRDLWYGSDLLSELSKAVVRSLQEQGCELIFPAVNDKEELKENSNLLVANKILAMAPADAIPEVILSHAKQDYFQFWQDLCSQVRGRLPAGCIDEKLYDAQAKDFGEFYGVWAKMNGSYKSTRNRTEQLLAGRKSLREFNAPTWDGGGKAKSSLDGIRENVVIKAEHLEQQHILKKGEKLDALGIVKRKGVSEKSKSDRPQFESLSQVAAQPYLAGLENDTKAQAIIHTFPDLSLLPSLNLPPQGQTNYQFLPRGFPEEWLLPACLAEMERENDLENDPTWKRLTEKIHKLHKHTGKPQSYACLLVGDGDHMGITLNALDNLEAHKRFSSALDRFARSMQVLVPKYGGGLIYSGGDDVMAYLPLHKSLACATAIQQQFADTMTEACRETGITAPTFSIGMAIVHHHMPLHSALELARRAEKTAKNQGGRNSLAIIQAKRGGSEQHIHGKWEAKEELAPFQIRLQAMVNLYKRGGLSSRLGYQLRRIALQTGESMEWRIIDGVIVPGNATAAETLRMVTRKRQQSGEPITEEDKIILLAGRTNLRGFADELVIAHQFAGAISLAQAGWLKKEDMQ